MNATMPFCTALCAAVLVSPPTRASTAERTALGSVTPYGIAFCALPLPTAGQSGSECSDRQPNVGTSALLPSADVADDHALLCASFNVGQPATTESVSTVPPPG